MDGDLKKTLTLFVQDSGGDLDKFRAHVERWFDEAMDRLSGIYTRLSQYMMLILGILIAVILNVDSIHMAQVLWESPSMRAALVASASQASSPAGGAATGSGGPTTGAPAGTINTVNQSFSGIEQQMRNLENTQIPFGWDLSGNKTITTFHGWTIVGWIITAGAISFGAPFWFSLLQQFGSVRNSGPPPKRVDQGSKAGGSSKPGN
jgi:hypothetical protein